VPDAPDSLPAGPLHGTRVLDLSRVLAGPLCTMILGDLGATVIKVERPGTGDETRDWGPPWSEGAEGRESAYYLSVNRNKRSITADLGDAADLARVRALAAGADVIVDNFPPGRLERWGLDHATLSGANPGLVSCTISGYGMEGPEAGRPGYDFAVQARAGWMAITGDPDGAPTKVGVAVVDVLTGQNAAIAVLAALQGRDRTGRGQRVGVSLFDSALAGLVNVTQAALVTGREAPRHGNAHPTIVPYQAFETADRPVVVAVGNDAQWRRLCGALGTPELAEDARFATNPDRVEARETLTPMLADRLRSRPAEDWLRDLDAAGVPCAPVQGVTEALADPVVSGRPGVLWPCEGRAFGRVRTVGSPLRLHETPAAPRRPPPSLGEHQDEITAHGWGTAPA
jgi:crotonobetainyl-CoA:carnitine CoA-transferase CaiB-like acyl-CoA transferase